MPQKSPDQVLKSLQKREYAPVYFFQGEETYYIDLLTTKLEKEVLSDEEKDFNLTVCYGKECTMSQVLTNARRFPIMAEKQVVIVKEAQAMADLNKAEGKNLLSHYLKQPQPATILVFGYKNKVLDGRTAFSKLVTKHGVLVTAKKLYDNQVPAWIAKYVKSQGYQISPKAISMLHAAIGNDLQRLANEFEKLKLHLKENEEISDDAIQTYVGISKDFNIFELQHAIGTKSIKKAQQIVQYFGANPQKKPTILVITLLFSFFNKLLLLHKAKSKGREELAKLLQVSPFFVKDYQTASRHYSLAKVCENIQFLHQADLQAKGVASPTMAEGEILKELVYKLMH